MTEKAQSSPQTARHRTGAIVTLLATFAMGPAACVQGDGEPGYGLAERPTAAAYLGMPSAASPNLPRLLSQTGAFADTATLAPAAGLIPYDIVFPFWSDGAIKSRWIAVPAEPIGFAPTGEWRFPGGTVLAKHFDLPVDDGDPTIRKRIETRLLVVGDTGNVYGAVYRWRDDASDAELLEDSLTEDIPIRTADGGTRTQTWYYPSRDDCLECHTDEAGGVLGVKTRQMNRAIRYPASGLTDNQLRAWSHAGLFDAGPDEVRIPTLDRLAPADDTTRSLEDRARSYLDANCSQCHRPGGTTAAYFDARYDTPLEEQGLVGGPVLYDQGIDRARVVSPNDIWRSIAYMRIDTLGEIKMPPLAHQTTDRAGVELLGEWIRSLPGPEVLAPPTIEPRGGNYADAVTVSITSDDPGAEIHFTLDGSAPGESDPLYEAPLELTGPTVLRARAFRENFTRSIPVQEIFIVAP
jgi:uncharacterized repeat protein (TIGR03806 family)